ncbi:MAG TPA: hypothetical protein VII40_11605 [Xanthobacteraceae bacterium]
MFRKSTTLSLAAAATFGILAISSSNASAFGHFGGGARGAVHFSAARVAGPHFALRQNFAVRQNFAIRRVAILKLYPPHPHHVHWGWWDHHRRFVWDAPIIAGGVTYASTPSYSSTPTSNTCNCLTKQYTQDGAVVFKDICTNEMAMNPPAADTAPQPPQGLAPQPMQQGYLQPQPAQ